MKLKDKVALVTVRFFRVVDLSSVGTMLGDDADNVRIDPNAIFAATGKRLRKLPIDTTALKRPA